MNNSSSLISSHKGELNQQQLNKILFEIKEALINLELDRSLVKKTYNIAVEIIENCLKHSTDAKIEFTLIHSGDQITIETKNIVNKKEIEKLESLLVQVNSLNKDDLLELYVEKLKHSVISEKGGAGLGIVDMAIKSKNKLGYSFFENDNATALFNLKVTIN